MVFKNKFFYTFLFIIISKNVFSFPFLGNNESKLEYSELESIHRETLFFVPNWFALPKNNVYSTSSNGYIPSSVSDVNYYYYISKSNDGEFIYINAINKFTKKNQKIYQTQKGILSIGTSKNNNRLGELLVALSDGSYKYITQNNNREWIEPKTLTLFIERSNYFSPGKMQLTYENGKKVVYILDATFQHQDNEEHAAIRVYSLDSTNILYSWPRIYISTTLPTTTSTCVIKQYISLSAKLIG